MLKQKYLEYHSDWLTHYVEGNYNNWFLAFKKEFMLEHLPGIDEVTVKLIDSEDNNKVYLMGWWLDFEEADSCYGILGKNYEHPTEPFWTLFQYIYQDKLCACNIKMGAQRAGAVLNNEECEGNRFQIESITFDDHPDLILYSEVFDSEQLEEILDGKVFT